MGEAPIGRKAVPASRTLALVLAALLSLCAETTFADEGNVRGVVTDESGGVLPGVTIVAKSADGRVMVTAVTDGAGRFVIGPLPTGQVTVTFELEGFAEATLRTAIPAEGDAEVRQKLALASRSESVEVIGRIPVPPPPPPPPPPPRPPKPKPVTIPVPEHDRDSICGPAKLTGKPESFGTVRVRLSANRELYSEGDELAIDGGVLSGLEVGRNYVVRRTFRIGWDPRTESGEHTAGVVQIVSADERTAVAVVIYACDEIMPGDRLAAFRPEPLRPPMSPGMPDYRYAAKILFPDFGQLLGAPRRLLVIDRGAADGVRVGQRVTVFRRRPGGREPDNVGDAVVVAVRVDSATIRVERVIDGVFFGDRAALHR
jgi:carboxypeptidase family protein